MTVVAATTSRSSNALATFGPLLFVAFLLVHLIEYIGLKADFEILRITRSTTVMVYFLFAMVLVKVGIDEAFSDRQTRVYIGFIVFTALSILWAYVQTYAFYAIRPAFDMLPMIIITKYLVDRPSRMDQLGLTFVVIAVVVFVRNLERLGDASRSRGFLAGTFMSDGNDFAWAMNVLWPLILGLMLGRRRLLTRGVAAVGVACCLMIIVGTSSRGGSLGMIAAGLYGWWFLSRRKALGAAAVAIVVIGVAIFAPDTYFSRMGTVANYEEDNSAQARLHAWGIATRMALDHPLGVGAGNFNSAYGRLYNNPTDSPLTWGAGRWISAHSVYFKVLGEYGFLGVGLVLFLIGSTFAENMRSRRAVMDKTDGAVPSHWPVVLNMSLLGYAVSGIFLGGVTYPHLFLIIGLTLGVKRLLAAADAVPAVAVTAAPPAATAVATTWRPPRRPLSTGAVSGHHRRVQARTFEG